MEPWTGAQRDFVVKALYKNGDNFVMAQREFRRVRDSSQSCCSIGPCHQDLGSKLRGCWFYSKEERWQCKNSTYAREYCGSERGHWKKSTTFCASALCVSLGLSEASVRRILHKDVHFYPYKIQVTHALRERDYVTKVNFC